MLSSTSHASELILNTNSVNTEETISKDIYLVANQEINDGNLDIAGNIDGDVYAVGNKIALSGNVTGNVFLIGSEIDISSETEIKKSVYIFGGNISLSGKISRDAIITGANVYSDAYIGEDLLVAFGKGTISGEIAEDLRVFAGEVIIEAKVGKDMILNAGLANYETAIINGQKTVDIDGMVRSDINFDQKIAIAEIFLNSLKISGSTLSLIITFVGLLGGILVSIFILKVTPRSSKKIISKINFTVNDLLSSLGWGVIIVLVGPFIVAILLISIVGIPLASLLIIIILLISIFGGVWIDTALGQVITTKLPSKYKNIYFQYLVGAMIRFLLSFIPFINGIVFLLTITITTGAIWRFRREK